MKLRSSIIIVVLVLLFVAHPNSSAFHDSSKEIIYEIDYRGPETHSYLPPPDMAGTQQQRDAQTKAPTTRNGVGDK
ncbi:uncharacterized protein LOC131253972 [Magnolia sinica]|uniref:uncharacterized protein LOC131253972 n=1 Tax=Magnolia sinica TaxID=86752 RepID=UPI00265981A6|nr:uncharacterized protein LOC131253972 [Magnolia sinica]